MFFNFRRCAPWHLLLKKEVLSCSFEALKNVTEILSGIPGPRVAFWSPSHYLSLESNFHNWEAPVLETCVPLLFPFCVILLCFWFSASVWYFCCGWFQMLSGSRLSRSLWLYLWRYLWKHGWNPRWRWNETHGAPRKPGRIPTPQRVGIAGWQVHASQDIRS